MGSNPKKKTQDSDTALPTLELFSSQAPSILRPSVDQRKSLRRDLESGTFSLVKDDSDYALVDISMQGFAIRLNDPTDLLTFPVRTEFSGLLKLASGSFPFRAQVRHQRVGIVGCQFTDSNEQLIKELLDVLDPTKLAHQLRAGVSRDGATHSFFAPSSTAVFVWQDTSGRISQFVVYVLSVYVRWTEGEGLKTGVVRATKRESGGTELADIEWITLTHDSSPAADKVATAVQLVENSDIPGDLRTSCLKLLSVR